MPAVRLAHPPHIWYTGMRNESNQPDRVETWARYIKALNLSAAALSLIEVARPFGFLGSQAFIVAQPLITRTTGETAMERALALLDDPGLLERLRMYLAEEEATT